MAANISILTCVSMSSIHGFTMSIHDVCRLSVGLSKPKEV